MAEVAKKIQSAAMGIPPITESSMICDLCKISFLRAGDKLTLIDKNLDKKQFCSHDCRDRYRLKFSNGSCAYCDIKVELKNCYTTPFEDGLLRFCTEIHAKCYLLQCKPDQVQEIEKRGHRNLVNNFQSNPELATKKTTPKTRVKKFKPVASAMTDLCTICTKNKQILYCITYNDITHKICSRKCFDNFCKKENLQELMVCEQCSEMIAPEQGDKVSMIFEGKKHAFCKTECMKTFQSLKRKVVKCGWCGKSKANLDMIEYAVLNRNEKQISHFCCLTCLTKYRALGSKKLMDCSICFKNAKPEYFIGYLNGQLENCCSIKCVHVRATEALASVRESVFVSRDGVYVTPQEVLAMTSSRMLLPFQNTNKRRIPETEINQKSPVAVKKVKGHAVPVNVGTKKVKAPNVAKSKLTQPPVNGIDDYLQDVDVDLIDISKSAKTIVHKTTPQKTKLSKSTFINTVPRTPKPPPPPKPTTTVVREFVPMPIPIPIPIYVPVPIMMFQQPVPEPTPIPVPMPCPILLPTTIDKADDLIAYISELKTKMPADPLEADIFAQAGLLEEEYSQKIEEIEPESLDVSLVSNIHDPIPILDNDLFIDTPVFEIEQDFNPLDWKVVNNPHSTRKSQRDRGSLNRRREPFHLDSKYGLSAWNIFQRSSKVDVKTDFADLTSVQLCLMLCKFVDNAKSSKGDVYRVDSLVYLLLGLQRYLNENKKDDEQIFLKPYYYQFQQKLAVLVDSWQPNIYPHFQIVDTRVWEEHLWESGQLGAHSPYTLIFTVIYFMTKYLPITSADELTQFSFKNIETTDTKHGSQLKVAEFDKPINSNQEDALRCPVKLIQFYISKCPKTATEGITTSIFLSPLRKVEPSSDTWFGCIYISKRELENIHSRVLMVKEVIQLWYDTGVYNSSNTETVME